MSEDFTNRPQDTGSAGTGADGSPPQQRGPHGATSPPDASAQGPGASGQRRLERTHEGRMIAGVCSGAGAYLGVDPNLIRIGLAVLAFFGAGTGIAAYAIGWLLVPEEGHQVSIAQDLFNKTKQ